jgi:hypothetical protein
MLGSIVGCESRASFCASRISSRVSLPATTSPLLMAALRLRVSDTGNCAAARLNHMCAMTLSCATPSPVAYRRPRLYCAYGNAMDYIDRLKRTAIPLGTIIVLSSGAALPQDQLTKADLVQLAVTLGVYDNRCERLPPSLLADLQLMVRMLDKGDVMAGVISEHDMVDRAGETKWCDAIRPVVEKYKDGLFEPTPRY